MTQTKQAKAKRRQADYQRRKNINKYQPKVHTIEKVAKYRPKVSTQTGKPIIDSNGRPVLDHVGYREVVRKKQKTKFVDGRNVRVLAIDFPISKKFQEQKRKLKRSH